MPADGTNTHANGHHNGNGVVESSTLVPIVNSHKPCYRHVQMDAE